MSNDTYYYYRSEVDFHPIRLVDSWDVPDSTEKLLKVISCYSGNDKKLS